MENQFNVASVFGVYASLSACLTLVKQSYHQFTPEQIRVYIDEKIKEWFSKSKILDPKIFTLVINQFDDKDGYGCNNGVYNACEVYLAEKLRSLSFRLEGCRRERGPVSYHLAQGEEYTEYVRLDLDDHNNNNRNNDNKVNGNVKLHWKFSCKNDKGEEDDSGRLKSFELSFDPRYKNTVLDTYLPSVVIKNYDVMIEKTKSIYLYTYKEMSSTQWQRVSFKHPFTFDALALDPELKKSIVDDLDRFIKRKEFYKKIGRAWKRGYLLYGPPGTGKSSLIAAIANHLKFNIYDLQLASIERDSTLRTLMMSITNKSILVIEDIDCASGLSRNALLPRASKNCDDDSGSDYESDDDDNNNHKVVAPANPEDHKSESSLSLSGILNFIDGLWSSCGDERIIILTTNYKERLDPALLRPGRMDMQVHMSYLRMPGFRILASNYHGLGEHPLFEEINELLEKTDVSPAEAAEELIRSEDPDVAFSGVVKMLKEKKLGQSCRNKVIVNKRGRKKATREEDDTDDDDDEPDTKKQKKKKRKSKKHRK